MSSRCRSGASPPGCRTRRAPPPSTRSRCGRDPAISLTLCEAAEGQEADEERFGHHRHSEGLNERTFGERPALEKQRSAFEFHGPIRFHSPYPDSILSDVLKRVHSSSVSFVEPLLHALLQEREVLLGVVRRTRRQLTELHEMNARDETAHMLLALQLQHARCCASTASRPPRISSRPTCRGAATRTAEVATQTEEDRRARFANLQDGRGVSGRGVSGRGDAASRNVSGRMGGSTGGTGRRSVGWMALKAELEHMLSPQRMQMQFDAWADGSVFDASEEEEEEAGGGGCCRADAAAACASGAREQPARPRHRPRHRPRRPRARRRAARPARHPGRDAVAARPHALGAARLICT